MHASLDSIQARIDDVLELHTRRDQDSDIRRGDSSALRRQFEAWLTHENERRTQEGLRRKRRNKVYTALTSVLGVIAGIAIVAWRTYESEKPTIEAVQRTIEDRTTALEGEVRVTDDRVGEVERKVQRLGEHAIEQQQQLIEGIGYLGQKLDAVSPRAEKVPEPPLLKAGREKAEKLKRQRKVDQIFDTEAIPPRPVDVP